MPRYIERNDYQAGIRNQRLQQLTDNNLTILNNAEDTAIAIISDALHSKYDVDNIFNKRGTNRDKQVVRWVCVLTLYYVYKRLPENLIPEDVVEDYQETISYLKDLEQGKRSTRLPRISKTTGQPKTNTRWGSLPPRSY